MGQQVGKPANPWFAGPMSKVDASKIVEAGSSGDYLIRSSPTDKCTFHLTVSDGGKASHYLIQQNQNGQFVMGSQTFEKMDDVFQLLKKRGIKGRNGKITLRKPLGAKARGIGSSTDITKGHVNSFYVGPLSREKSEEVICSHKPGDYLVRQSIKDPSNFFLTVNDDGQPVHFKIVQQPDGKFMLGKLEYTEVGAIVDVLLKRGIKGRAHKISLQAPLGQHVAQNRTEPPPAPEFEWYVASSSQTDVKRDLCAASHGDYLVHQTADYPFLYKLYVNVKGASKMWTMVWEDDHFVLGERRFNTLVDIINAFRVEGLTIGGAKLHLQNPARRHRNVLSTTGSNMSISTTDRDRASTMWEKPKLNVRQTSPEKRSSSASVQSSRQMSPESRKSSVASVQQSNADEAKPPIPSREYRERAATAWNRPSASNADLQPPVPAPRPAHTRARPDCASSRISISSHLSTTSSTDAVHESVAGDQNSMFVAPLDVDGFLNLPRRTTNEAEVPEFGRGKGPNRYKNVLPNPVTRVRLLVERGQSQDREYYNANYVRGFGGRNVHEYIAAQAPLAESVEKFVRLMWERGCVAIVMLTGLIEGRKRKCERYWPEHVYRSPGDEFVAGAITVKKVSQEEKQGYIVCTLELQCGKETRQVKHFWYNTWPDHGVPANDDGDIDPKWMTEMILSVRKYRNSADNSRSPLLVHCSAGIGRSGTYIVIDQAFTAIDRKEVVDLVDLIDKIRQDRMSMVQESSQYKFAFQACIDYAREHQKAQIYARPRNSSSMKKMAESGGWRLHNIGEDTSTDGADPIFAFTGEARLKTDDNDTCVFVTDEDDEHITSSAAGSSHSLNPPQPRRVSVPSPLNQRKTKRLEDQPWYRSGISRDQVEQLLQSTPKGTFIVRTSSVEGHYALTLQEGDRIVSMLIVPTITSGIRKYKLGRTGQELFSSVTELVSHYMEAPVRADAAGEFITLRLFDGNDNEEEC